MATTPPTTTAEVRAELEEMQAHLEETRAMTPNTTTVEVIRRAITTMCAHQHRLIALIRLRKEDKKKVPWKTADLNALLEKVVDQIATLMDLAQASASITPIPTTPDSTLSPSATTATAAAAAMIQHQKQQQTHGNSSSSNDLKSFLEGPPEIDEDQISYDPVADLIGEGAFGKVYKAVCKGKEVAVKVPTKQVLTEAEMAAFRREVTILRKVFHPNVVLFLGACTKPGKKLMIVTELLRGGDVEHKIHPTTIAAKAALKQKPLTLLQRLRMAYDAALGINWLHGICGIVHRDLKPANMLIDEQGHVKVTDFGFSEIIRSGSHHNKDVKGPKGTALYMAPEVMKLEEFDASSDVYSFSMILYEIATGHEPFEQYTQMAPFVHAVTKLHERPVIPEDSQLPPSLIELMNLCWDPVPESRIKFPEIVARLENAIVDAALPASNKAKEFWKQQFLNPLCEQVQWHDFSAALSKVLNEPMETVELLEKLVIGEGSDNPSMTHLLTLERFNQVCVWFSDWFVPENGHLYEEMLMIAQAPWFHNDISLNESVARLRTRAVGTFLIRMSFTDKRAPMTLSLTTANGGFDHKRVYRLTFDPSPERYAIQMGNGTTFSKFPSLPDLLQALQTAGTLSLPCPKNKVEVAYI